MRRPWLLLSVVAIALASAVLVPAAGAAAASAEAAAMASAGAMPALVLTASPATLTSGGATVLAARLGIAGATVRLSRKAAGDAEFTLISTFVTDATGAVSYRAAPRVTTTYRADFSGDAEWSPASSEATVTVRPRLRLFAPATVYRGDPRAAHGAGRARASGSRGDHRDVERRRLGSVARRDAGRRIARRAAVDRRPGRPPGVPRHHGGRRRARRRRLRRAARPHPEAEPLRRPARRRAYRRRRPLAVHDVLLLVRARGALVSLRAGAPVAAHAAAATSASTPRG